MLVYIWQVSIYFGIALMQLLAETGSLLPVVVLKKTRNVGSYDCQPLKIVGQPLKCKRIRLCQKIHYQLTLTLIRFARCLRCLRSGLPLPSPIIFFYGHAGILTQVFWVLSIVPHCSNPLVNSNLKKRINKADIY